MSATPTATSTASLRHSLTVPLGELSDVLPAELLERPDLRALLDAESVTCWTTRGLGLVGFGRAASFAAVGEDRFTAARAWWDDVVEGLSIRDPLHRSATGPVAFGAFAFARSSTRRSGLVVPELVIGHDADGAWATLVTSAEAAPGADDVVAAAHRLLPEPRTARGSGDDRAPAGDPATASPRALEDPAAQARWTDAVSAGIEEIRAGGVDKLVLARAVPVAAPEGARLDLPRALRRLAHDYERCWTYSVNVQDDRDPAAGRLFGATPERLVRVLDGAVHARVLAGTVPRTSSGPATEAERAWARGRLMDDPKQRSEHEFAIGSFLDGIAAYTDAVRSPSQPYLLELPNVWHLASDVTCDLRRGPDGTVPSALELVEAVHPTAAVCGTPTTAAADAIARLEGLDRGLYAGPVGWVDARRNGDFGIALRGGVQDDEATARVFAGCGIVSASDPAEELAETRAKLRPVLGALGAS
ncbi:isochorismate synthase MenF [Kocuria palustris]|uniref:isochorismate synthase n=1 Tax=Kocuria palustris TaxID=71999 RepID=UPI00119E78E1|nr:chorismate-binding protein [Kocuria palustris]